MVVIRDVLSVDLGSEGIEVPPEVEVGEGNLEVDPHAEEANLDSYQGKPRCILPMFLNILLYHIVQLCLCIRC